MSRATRQPKQSKAIVAAHVFLATRDKTCVICGETIHKNENYVMIEPKDRKCAAFVACIKCGGKVQA